MEIAFNIAALIISVASLAGMILIARGNWTHMDRASVEARLAALERAVSTVDERIKDAAHARVKMADFIEFAHETRETMQQLAFELKDGLHDRLSKAEFAEFRREFVKSTRRPT